MDYFKKITGNSNEESFRSYSNSIPKQESEHQDSQHISISMEQLHQAMHSSMSNGHQMLPLTLSPRQMSTLMLKTNLTRNYINDMPTNLSRNINNEIDNDTLRLLHEDIARNISESQQREIEQVALGLHHEGLHNNIMQDHEIDLSQHLNRDGDVRYSEAINTENRLQDMPMPFQIKAEHDDFYKNVAQGFAQGTSQMHIQNENVPMIQQVFNYNTNLPMDLFRQQNFIQNYTAVRDNPENLVVKHYDYEEKKIPTKNNLTQKPLEVTQSELPQTIIETESNENIKPNQHTTVTTGIAEEFSCFKCKIKFSSKRSLKQHSKTCVDGSEIGKEGKYNCEHCSYKCQSPAILKIHLRTHSGDKPFSCTYCSYRSGQKNNVAKHILVHMKEKPYSCQYCSYKCAQKNNLVVHERTHTGYKPFACVYCDYRTVQKPNLVKHMYLHTDQKPFQCDICTYKCVQKTNLTKHKQRHLLDGEKLFKPRQKNLKCDLCNYKCVQQNSLDKHVLDKHSEIPLENESVQDLCIKKDFEQIV